MKNKFLSVCMVILLCTLSFGTIPAFAATYGNLTYKITDGEVTITDCETSATAVNVPSTIAGYPVTGIGNYAFYYCISLKSVTIGNGVTSIGSSAFSGCSSLTSITAEANNPNYYSLNGVLFDKAVKKLIQYPAGKTETTYVIPDSVTSIGDYAFYYCKSLKSITIPDSVTSIGDYAFSSCDNLTNITIPDSVTSIGYSAFRYCDSLTSVTIGNSVTSIGIWAFYGCRSLTSVTIGNGVTSIGYSAFYDCSSLKTISYNGTQEDWDSISIDDDNAPLLSATKHFFFYVTYIDENKNETRITVNPEEVPDVSSIEKTGYTLHLYTDEVHTTEFDKNTPITENTTLYVSYTVHQRTYKFLDSDGSVIKEKTVDYGTEIIPPANPSDKDPYTFDYWKGYTSGMTATSDQTFTAVYKYKNYTITADGLAKPISVTYNSTFTIPPQTKYDYYYFIGYFTEKNGKGTKITNEKGESLKPYNTIGDITVYPHFYERNMNKIILQGTASVMPGGTVTQKAVFATETNASYLIATIRYPDWLILKSVEGVDFAEVSKDSETQKDGYKELQITCIYDYNSSAIPTYKDIIPFELKFSVSTDAPIGNAEISLKDVLLIGEADYPISETESAVLEILPKLAERIQISGPSAIDKTTKYTASVSPDYTTDKTVTWSVDNESIATVSEDGFLTPVTNGTVTLTATAKDGSGVYARKTVSVTVYAKINTLVSDCGVWETNFNPEIYDYTIYVKNDTASITLTPNFVDGTLKPNGTGLWISGRSKSFDLPDKETVITLNRSNVANATDKAYNITVIKLDGIQTEVSEDGLSFKVQLGNVGTGKIVFLALYENGRLAELQSATYEESPLTFTTTATYTSAKVMVWKSVDSSKPVYEAKIIK